MGGHPYAQSALTLASVLGGCWISAAAPTPPDLQSIVARVGTRVAEYYRRAQSLVCTDVYTVLPVEPDWSPVGARRTVESELHVELTPVSVGGLPQATDVRKVLSINGHAPRERDQKGPAGCTDPNPLSPEPLEFLLPPHRGEYRFTSLKDGHERGRAALLIDFVSADRKSHLEAHKRQGWDGDCIEVEGPAEMRGRVWVDAMTYDVLRLDEHLAGPTDVRVPWELRREEGFEDTLVLDRDDLTLRYQPVAFTDPDEVLVLPSSVDSMVAFRGGLQSTRRTDTFSDYRRFLTRGRVIRDVP